jgi:hypothetical protein
MSRGRRVSRAERRAGRGRHAIGRTADADLAAGGGPPPAAGDADLTWAGPYGADDYPDDGGGAGVRGKVRRLFGK